MEQARRLVPLDRQGWHGLAGDEVCDEGEHVEGAVIAIDLTGFLEEQVAAGLVGDSRHRHDLALFHIGKPGRGRARVGHSAVEIKIALNPVEEP